MESRVKAAFAILSVATAVALTSCERDETPPRTKLDAQQAIAAATAAVPGSPQGVRLERRRDGAAYEVTIVPGDGRPRVRVDVDANSGQILSSGARSRRDRDEDDSQPAEHAEPRGGPASRKEWP